MGILISLSASSPCCKILFQGCILFCGKGTCIFSVTVMDIGVHSDDVLDGGIRKRLRLAGRRFGSNGSIRSNAGGTFGSTDSACVISIFNSTGCSGFIAVIFTWVHKRIVLCRRFAGNLDFPDGQAQVVFRDVFIHHYGLLPRREGAGDHDVDFFGFTDMRARAGADIRSFNHTQAGFRGIHIAVDGDGCLILVFCLLGCGVVLPGYGAGAFRDLPDGDLFHSRVQCNVNACRSFHIAVHCHIYLSPEVIDINAGAVGFDGGGLRAAFRAGSIGAGGFGCRRCIFCLDAGACGRFSRDGGFPFCGRVCPGCIIFADGHVRRSALAHRYGNTGRSFPGCADTAGIDFRLPAAGRRGLHASAGGVDIAALETVAVSGADVDGCGAAAAGRRSLHAHGVSTFRCYRTVNHDSCAAAVGGLCMNTDGFAA